MAAHRTGDEVLQNYKAKMGATLGAEFNRLWNECTWLHVKWRDYLALFDTSQARMDLLNASARGYFIMVEETMRHDLMLHVCRLTDKPSDEGRRRAERLSILRLTAQVDPGIHDKVRGLVSKATKKTKFARDWRNRHIAHRDLRLAMKEGAKPLAPAGRRRMGEAIEAIASVLSAVEIHYCHTAGTAYNLVSDLGDGAEALLYVLREGLEAREEEMRQLQAGQLPVGGFKPKLPI